jgi:Ca-activated chloride channel homolog
MTPHRPAADMTSAEITSSLTFDRARWALAVCLCLLALALVGGCTKVVYVVQNPDGTFTEVEQRGRDVVDPRTGGVQVAHTGGDALIIDILTSNDVVYIEDDGPLFVQVTLGAREDIQLDERASYNLSIVIDRSGSMSGEKMLSAKAAADWLVDQLGDDDQVSLVTYASDVRVDVPSTRLNPGSRAHLHNAIGALYSGGGTYLSGGMEAGAGEVLTSMDRERINRVVLLSDGNANEGVTSIAELTRRADILRERGVSITTMGVGYDYNEDLMMAVATYGGGNYYYIERAEALAQVFGQELSMLGNTIVRDAVVELELPPGVRVQEVYGYPYEQQGQSLKVKMNAVSAGEQRKLLMAFDLPDHQAPGEVEVARGRVTFRNEMTKANDEVAFQPLKVQLSSDRAAAQASLNLPVMEKVEAVRNAQARQEAMHHLDRGDAQAAQQVIQQRVNESAQVNATANSGAIGQGISSMQSLQKKAAAAPAPASADYKHMRKSETQDALMEMTH